MPNNIVKQIAIAVVAGIISTMIYEKYIKEKVSA